MDVSCFNIYSGGKVWNGKATRARCLTVFHALSGCDTTSAFVGKGKHSAWQAWQLYNEVTPTPVSLAENPYKHLDVDSEDFRKIERMAVIIYGKTCPYDSINEARKELFCKDNRAMDKLPPTKVTKIYANIFQIQ